MKLLLIALLVFAFPGWSAEHRHPAALSARKCVASGNWSDPATWGGKLPLADQDVTVPRGRVVTYDLTAPPLGNLFVEGRLLAADRPGLALTAKNVMAQHGGIIEVGSVAKPRKNDFLLTLTGTDPDAIPDMGGRVLGAHHGGKLIFVAEAPKKTWGMLNATAKAGAEAIVLDLPVTWPVGAEIIVTTTVVDYTQTEKRRIVATDGLTLTLDAPLKFEHCGEKAIYRHDKAGVPKAIDTRAEVALLSHRIVIHGGDDAAARSFGGHIMAHAGVMQFEGVELRDMGQFGAMGRYPWHLHDCGEATESFARKCSVNRSFNRGFVIHKTNRVRLDDNVVFDSQGFAYFLEDGKETRNVFTRCLAATTRIGGVDAIADGGQNKPAAFWFANPDNDVIDCVAAGVGPNGTGFHYELPEHPRKGSISEDDTYFPRDQPLGVLRGYRVHSISRNGGDGGWGVAIGMNRGRGEVMSGGTIFAMDGSAHHAQRLLAGEIFIDGGAFHATHVISKGNQTLRRCLAVSPGGFSNLLTSYDGVPQAEHCVGIGYSAAITGLNNVSTASRLKDCRMIKSYMARETSEFIMRINDFGDTFGNGGPGTFVNMPLSLDQTARNRAKGIQPDDRETHWTPQRCAIVGISLTGFTGVTASLGGKELPLQRNHMGAFILNRPYSLTFTGRGRLHFLEFGGPVPPEMPATDAFIFSLAHPAGLRALAFSREEPESGPVVSKRAFDAARGPAWFSDGARLHVRMPHRNATTTFLYSK